MGLVERLTHSTWMVHMAQLILGVHGVGDTKSGEVGRALATALPDQQQPGSIIREICWNEVVRPLVSSQRLDPTSVQDLAVILAKASLLDDVLTPGERNSFLNKFLGFCFFAAEVSLAWVISIGLWVLPIFRLFELGTPFVTQMYVRVPWLLIRYGLYLFVGAMTAYLTLGIANSALCRSLTFLRLVFFRLALLILRPFLLTLYSMSDHGVGTVTRRPGVWKPLTE